MLRLVTGSDYSGHWSTDGQLPGIYIWCPYEPAYRLLKVSFLRSSVNERFPPISFHVALLNWKSEGGSYLFFL